MHRYLERDSAVIYLSRARFGVGSNMVSGYPIHHQNRMFYSTEVLYQLARFSVDVFAPIVGNKSLYDLINLPNAMAAKRAAHKFIHLTKWDWHSERIVAMETCLRLKLQQHTSRVLAFLDDTGDMLIVEKSNRDDTWGAIPQKDGWLLGYNMLGNLWMIIREEQRSGALPAPGLIQFWQNVPAPLAK